MLVRGRGSRRQFQVGKSQYDFRLQVASSACWEGRGCFPRSNLCRQAPLLSVLTLQPAPVLSSRLLVNTAFMRLSSLRTGVGIWGLAFVFMFCPCWYRPETGPAKCHGFSKSHSPFAEASSSTLDAPFVFHCPEKPLKTSGTLWSPAGHTQSPCLSFVPGQASKSFKFPYLAQGAHSVNV